MICIIMCLEITQSYHYISQFRSPACISSCNKKSKFLFSMFQVSHSRIHMCNESKKCRFYHVITGATVYQDLCCHMASLGWYGLTHWGWDKMVAISQMTLSNPFLWMKIFDLGDNDQAARVFYATLGFWRNHLPCVRGCWMNNTRTDRSLFPL